jgi:hypothetical protein
VAIAYLYEAAADAPWEAARGCGAVLGVSLRDVLRGVAVLGIPIESSRAEQRGLPLVVSYARRIETISWTPCLSLNENVVPSGFRDRATCGRSRGTSFGLKPSATDEGRSRMRLSTSALMALAPIAFAIFSDGDATLSAELRHAHDARTSSVSSGDAAQLAGVVVPSYPDSRRVDAASEFANVGALITMAEKNDAGVPEGNLGQCSGTLIHERVFLTAGHCICPGLPTPPPFVRTFVSFAADARDRATWLPVSKIAGHPSLLPCKPPRFIEAYGAPPIPGMHDVGLVFLEGPIRGIAPARLAKPGALDAPAAFRTPMLIVGYGHLRSIPAEQRWKEWDGTRRIRSKSLVQVIDDTWATWALPGEVCDGDSGGPIFLGSGSDRAIVATVSWDGGCRGGSLHARTDVASVQSWIEQTITATLGNQ